MGVGGRRVSEGREAGAPKGWEKKIQWGVKQHKKVWELGETKVGNAEKQDKGSGRFQPPTPPPPPFHPPL